MFRGRTHWNHNRLLQEYEGTDGIKTGYVNDSGFNLVASAQRDGVRLVAAVFGGRTGRERDRHMMTILDRGFAAMGVAPRDDDGGDGARRCLARRAGPPRRGAARARRAAPRPAHGVAGGRPRPRPPRATAPARRQRRRREHPVQRQPRPRAARRPAAADAARGVRGARRGSSRATHGRGRPPAARASRARRAPAPAAARRGSPAEAPAGRLGRRSPAVPGPRRRRRPAPSRCRSAAAAQRAGRRQARGAGRPLRPSRRGRRPARGTPPGRSRTPTYQSWRSTVGSQWPGTSRSFSPSAGARRRPRSASVPCSSEAPA